MGLRGAGRNLSSSGCAASRGQQAARPMSTPGVSTPIAAESEEPVDPERAKLFRSACVRLGYLALGRPGMQLVALRGNAHEAWLSPLSGASRC